MESGTQTRQPEAETQDKPGTGMVEALTQLNMRILFLECALTVLVHQLLSQGILPRNMEDRLIADTEALMGTGDRTKGRGELVAAFIGNGDS
jgi:hypothetical protein